MRTRRAKKILLEELASGWLVDLNADSEEQPMLADRFSFQTLRQAIAKINEELGEVTIQEVK